MEIKELLEPIRLEYEGRIGDLGIEAQGVVKSKKNFPIYMIDDEEYIFKPLSKSKPMTTEMYAYAEVYWSYVMKKYFNDNTPLYRLAYCKGIEERYYEKGTLVKKIDGEFINLLSYFNENPESSFDISDYINYCMMDYDYTFILESDFIRNNRKLGEDLAFHILLSILRMDQNYHYENVNMIESNGVYRLVEPIDSEFSTPFLYPDNLNGRFYYISKYLSNLSFPFQIYVDIAESLGKDKKIKAHSTLFRNLFVIVRDYGEVVDRFLEDLDKYYRDIDEIDLSDNYGYIEACSSDYWMIGDAKYKKKDMKEYEKLLGEITKQEIDKDLVFKLIKNDIKNVIIRIKSIIKGIRLFNEKGYNKIEDMTLEKIVEILGISIDKKEDVYSKILEYK